MRTEEETELHRGNVKEEETHPREGEAEKAVTQDFVIIATRSQTILQIHAPSPGKREEGLREGQ